MIARGERLLSRVRDFIDGETKDEFNLATVLKLLKADQEDSEAQLRLQEEIQKLIMRIEAGEPLLRLYDTCPKVYHNKA